ncbi:hypothetical protein EWM64_g8190 [Hericium alpestre]|uniref:NAD-dependent epimerase/dehydratase domain-containing protein n=1 Tax=Hericium alpestre TaxID=135208 RepID=A0A4Y9ZM15_9AGAM|nr:hypothetical protein EWM64_g8190 [Hericium alpestre]
MTIASTPGKVLVTGANGFIAVWLVQRLLQKGYIVRGTVRSEKKAVHLRELFKSYGEKLELVVVEDITKEGAFDEAVKGMDLVEHTSSPFHHRVSHPDELIGPAVKGTVGILESIKKHAPSVKRVVITSSMAAVLDSFGKNNSPITRYDESSWNNSVIEYVEKKGTDSEPPYWYFASKTLAEKAAWDFVEKNKSEIKFDIVVLNPPYVWGPTLAEINSSADLNESLSMLHTFLIKTDSTPDFPTDPSGWVDVRDVAEAHVLAAETPAAGGNRFIISGGSYHWQEILDTANAVKPQLIHNLVKGNPGTGKDISASLVFDTAKAERVLGIKFHTLDQTIADILADWKQKGFAA